MMTDASAACVPLVGRVSAAWSRAAAAHAVVRRCFRWDRETIAVDFAGDAAIPALTRAVAHRECQSDEEPTLTISVWDGASTGVDSGLADDVETTVNHADAGLVRSGETVSVLDRSARRGYFWTPSVAALPVWMLGGPWRALLHGWWRPLGRQIVHAAAVGRHGRGVLIVGRGGIGKSTTAFACLRAGMDWLADDYCLLAPEPELRAIGLYATGKLTDDSVTTFPELADFVSVLPGALRCDSPKHLYFLDPRFRPQLATSIAIAAMLMPEISTGRATEIVPASRADGLRAIAPSTLLQTPGAGDADLRQMARVAQAVPSYRLRLGRNLDGVIGAIEEFLAKPR
jgi:hypothetical protein